MRFHRQLLVGARRCYSNIRSSQFCRCPPAVARESMSSPRRSHDPWLSLLSDAKESAPAEWGGTSAGAPPAEGGGTSSETPQGDASAPAEGGGTSRGQPLEILWWGRWTRVLVAHGPCVGCAVGWVRRPAGLEQDPRLGPQRRPFGQYYVDIIQESVEDMRVDDEEAKEEE